MENFIRFAAIPRILLLLFLTAGASLSLCSAETNLTAVTVVEPSTNSDRVVPSETDRQLRSYLKLQEQLHSTLQAIEQARLEASLEARTNAELLSTRLELLERNLARQRELQLKASQDSGVIALWIGGGIVAIGLIALAASMYFQTRGVHRLAQVADGFHNDRALLGGSLPIGLVSSERLLPASGASGTGNRTLLATIDRLEQRVLELEGTSTGEIAIENGDAPETKTRRRNGTVHRRPADQSSVLLSKGTVLLTLGKPEEALSCFDDAITTSPNLADAHLKRGMALEKLKRPDDAIRSYDRAIALNKSLTQAYLSKGAIFNQQERFNEALECYEQALRSESDAASR